MTSKYPSLGLSLAFGLLCDEDLCDGFVFIFSLLWQCRLGFCFVFFWEGGGIECWSRKLDIDLGFHH